MTSFLSQIAAKYHGLASREVVEAVKNAAAKTGVDFSFLMEKAAAESGFNPAAGSKSSSATGLFQFIESTWLHMVKEYGPKYGLGGMAAQIRIRDGKPCVDDCAEKEAILELRKNPEIAALMAGAFSAANRRHLEANTTGAVGAAEMYFAHFMGPGGAVKFLNARAQDGSAIAASIFPKEAAANKNVFFDAATGAARTLDGVYAFFAKKFGNTQTAELAQPSPSSVSFSQDSGFRRNDAKGAAAFPTIVINDSFALLQSLPLSKLSVDAILLLAQTHRREEDPFYNS